MADKLLGYLWRPLLFKDNEIALGMWAEQFRLAQRPYRVVAGLDENETYRRIPRYALVTRVLMPVCSSACRDSAQASVGLAQTAMALKAYKSRFGSYPASLTDLKARLCWKLPDDPFSGRPFRYRREGKGFVVYSVGLNLKDDGGHWKPGYDESRGDIIRQVER